MSVVKRALGAGLLSQEGQNPKGHPLEPPCFTQCVRRLSFFRRTEKRGKTFPGASGIEVHRGSSRSRTRSHKAAAGMYDPCAGKTVRFVPGRGKPPADR